MSGLIHITYFATALLFIVGLKRMSSPTGARSGIRWAGGAMLLATLVTFGWPGLQNIGWILIALVCGGAIAWLAAKRVAMTNMPQMIAIYNGMGGGAAGAIGAVELLRDAAHGIGLTTLAVVGGLIGAVAFSGSMIAFAKLQGLMGERPLTFPHQRWINAGALLAALFFGALLVATHVPPLIFLFFLAALAVGVMMTLPIGGGDMPVVISLYNALT
ncbi:MAG: NAD(P)(+) transhydrogenase (Re/Si-specific) subunit beta, partial [Deltaproteobacteria bacterium]|nr:NAD(P)(+) transhydrogenase (Re/Si-specific) subunit beta [Deltaproteobacteria bacterium]